MKTKFVLSDCKSCIIFLLICFSATSLYPQQISFDYSSDLEKSLLGEWGKARLTPEDLISWLLIAEGVDSSQTIQDFKKNLDGIYISLDRKVKPNNSVKKNSREIFKYLHNNVFKKYVINTKLRSTFENQQYNCVTASALFYVICQHYNIPVSLYETSDHIFCAVDDDSRMIRIDLTDPKDGFDQKNNKKVIIKFLLQYKLITNEELMSKGEDAIYSEFVEQTNMISPEKLLGITYFNMGTYSLLDKSIYEGISYYEKGIHVDVTNERYKEVYRYTLTALLSGNANVKKDYDKLLLIFQRSAILMKDDEEFILTSSMSILKKIIGHYMLEEKDFPKSMDILVYCV